MDGTEEQVDLAPDDAEVEIQLEGEQSGSEKPKVEEQPDDREVALSELRQQLEAARKQAVMATQAKQQAEQYARQQADAAFSARTEASENQYRVIINAINASEQASENAERALAEALATGDYANVAKIQSHIAKIQSQLTQFEGAKAELEERAQYQTASGRVPDPQPQYQPQQQAPQDPLELLASRLTPKSATWLREHPEMVHQVAKLKTAHEAAINLEGITVESPEYFNYIEQKLGIGNKSSAPKKPQASAPVNSSSSYSASRGGNDTVRLSAAEVEQAMLNEPNLGKKEALEIYAKNKMALIKEGRL